MNRVPSQHPARAELEAFGLGTLVPAEAAAVEQHVTLCEACCRTLDALADDSLVAVLRPPASASTDTAASAEPSGGAGRQATADFPLPPELVGHPRYFLQALVGRGGMGTVYRAEHRLMERTVALKVIRRDLTDRPGVVERFRREVRAAARLSHPHIVTVHDADQAGATHFLVMEHVAGTTLSSLVREQGPLPVARACDYVRQAALGLQHAFEHGMVHRDIKPHNLMLTPDGQVKVLDFGLARLASEVDPAEAPGGAGPDVSATASGMLLGSADYVAPEQVADPHAADVRADIYGLGCTLYFLLTGQPPFPVGTLAQKLEAQARSTPRPLATLRSGLPPGLARILGRMMAKDPAERYQTPAEVAEALAPFAGERTRRRRRWLLAAAAVVVALALSASLLGTAVLRRAPSTGQFDFATEDPSAQVKVLQGEKQVRLLDLATDQSLDLPPGEYELKLVTR